MQCTLRVQRTADSKRLRNKLCMKPRNRSTNWDYKMLQLQFKVCTQSLSAVTVYILASTDRAIRQHQSINTNFIVNVVFLITILYFVDDNIYSCRFIDQATIANTNLTLWIKLRHVRRGHIHTLPLSNIYRHVSSIQFIQLQLHFIASTTQLSTETNYFHEKSCEVNAGRFQHTIHMERHTFSIKHIRHWSAYSRTR